MHLGLIGTGRWGQNILRTLREELHVTVTTSSSAEETKSLQIIAEQGQLDGIVVATPGTTHAAIAETFLVLGIPIFVEKPFTTNLKDAKDLINLARQHQATLMVGHIHLYNPAYQAAKELLPDLGPLRHLHFESMNNGPYRSDMSALWDWAPHDVVMALDLLQSQPTEVSAWGINALRPHTNLTDTIFAKLDFPSTPVTMHLSWLMPEKRKKLTIVGERSTLIYDDTVEHKLTLYKNMGPQVTGSTVTAKQPEISHPVYETDSPLTKELAVFLERINGKKVDETEFDRDIKVTEIIEQIEQVISA